MKRKTSFRKIIITSVIVSVIVCVLTAAALIWGGLKPIGGVLLVLTTGGALSLAWGFTAACERRVTAIFDDLNRCMDEMINDAKEVEFQITEAPETVVARAQNKLLRLYGILQNSSRESAAQKQIIQGLIGDISHQVKTPIANIKMYLSILQEEDLPEEKRIAFAALAAGEGDKLEFLIQSMIKMSRLETGVIQVKPVVAPVYNTVASALGEIALRAEQKKLNVSVDCGEDILVCHDARWTEEALFNLLDNAVKYTEEQGNIWVKVSRWDCYARIDVADSGRGIAEPEQGAVFKRFYRGADVRDEEGIGVGLYLAREIIQKQGGYIQVSSQLKKGSIFSVFLPVECEL
ncbi:HAMP domain-containing sensor histidine kinase [Anaerolentibacter hominis]|uniref:sensor histidine kinase n=1 Tax=Anaerolentibacter hominis TaxID=3079009 RepID=UPI0031B8A4DA